MGNSAMERVRPLIFHPADLTGEKTGGIQSFVRDFVTFAPEDFAIECIGATADTGRIPLRRWTTVSLRGRDVRYLAISTAPPGNRRDRVPIALRYTLALAAHRRLIATSGRVLNFHRAGVPLALVDVDAPRVQFTHLNVTDIYTKRGESRWRLLPGAYHRVEDLTRRQMDRIYVVNEHGVDFYRKRDPTIADRVRFLSTWYDDTMFRPPSGDERQAQRARFGLDPSSPVALFVGRLEAQKDPVLVVEGFARAQRADRSLHLLVVGSGRLEGAVRRAVSERGLANAVTFLGALPREGVAEVMQAADVLLLPSRFEGMPITVLEAIGTGLAVVATPVGEVPRLVQPGLTGSLVEATPTGLGDGLVEALAMPEAHRRAACLRVAGRYRAADVLGPVYDYQRHLTHVRQRPTEGPKAGR